MTIDNLIKGEVYYVESSKSKNKYVFVFDKLVGDDILSGAYKCLQSCMSHSHAKLINIHNIVDLRSATPEEKEMLGIKTSIKTPNRFKIHKCLKLTFKL